MEHSATTLPTRFAPAERATPEHLKRQTDLVKSVVLLTQAMEAAPDIVTVLNKNRQIVYANKYLLELLGLVEVRPLLGLRPGEALHCVHSSEAPGGCGTSEACAQCDAVCAILNGQAGKRDVRECHILLENSDAIDLRVTATPIQVGDEVYTIFAATDISGEKRRRALERLFFHDVMNTAGGIMGYAAMLQDSRPEEIQVLSTRIYNLTNGLIEEIRAQKTLTQAEANDLTVVPEPLNVAELLKEVALVFEHHKVRLGRYLQVNIVDPVLTMISDRILLKRALCNLVKNGFEAVPEGGTVEIGSRAQEDKILFWVQSPDVAMPRDVQLQVFQRSFTTKGDGRGLGTYSVKLLTERYLRGRVWFTSDETKGTTFYLLYPRTVEG